VYDGVGQATFPASLDCLRPHGTFVSFGSASGPIKAFDINLLAQKGSLFATRPTLFTFANKRADLLAMADNLFQIIHAGKVTFNVTNRFALADAADAHRALEGRKTIGASVLLV
jgi:NADPH2:quinone reductase